MAAMVMPSSDLINGCNSSTAEEEEEEEIVTVLVPVLKNQQPYKCGVCGGRFDSLDALTAHIQQHVALRPYQCRYCRVGFETNAELSLHFNTVKHELVEWMTLPENGSLSLGKGNAERCLNEKTQTFQSEAGIVCEQGKVVDEAVSGDDVCESVSDTFDSYEEFGSSKQKKMTGSGGHASKKRDAITCPICKERFQRQIDLKKHCVDNHGDDRPFQCPHCPSRHKQKVHLTYHINSAHSSHKPFSCSACGDRFKLRCHLKYHLSSKHQVEPSSILHRQSVTSGARRRTKMAQQLTTVCQQQHTETAEGYSSSTPSSAVADRQAAAAPTPADESSDVIKCPTCGKTFQLQVDLKKHSIMEHYDDRPFQCPYCFLRYKQKIHLTYHISSVHSTRRPLACLVCGDRFKLRGHLKYHLLSKHLIEPSTVLKRPSRKRRSENDSKLSQDTQTASGSEDETNGCGQTAVGEKTRVKPDTMTKAGHDADTALHHIYTELALKINALGTPHAEDLAAETGMETASPDMDKLSPLHLKGDGALQMGTVDVPSASSQLGEEVARLVTAGSLSEEDEQDSLKVKQRGKRSKPVGANSKGVGSDSSVRQKLKCSVCGITFSSYMKLWDHWMCAHSSCECGQWFEDPGTMDSHRRSAHGCTKQTLKPFECVVCGAAFNMTRSLREHIHRLHKKKEPLSQRGSGARQKRGRTSAAEGGSRLQVKCGLCHAKFSSVLQAEGHWRRLHNTCHCGESFADPGKMDSHKNDVHIQTDMQNNKHTNAQDKKQIGKHDATFLCGRCGAGFQLARSLTYHVCQHQEDKASSPERCPKHKRTSKKTRVAASAATSVSSTNRGDNTKDPVTSTGNTVVEPPPKKHPYRTRGSQRHSQGPARQGVQCSPWEGGSKRQMCDHQTMDHAYSLPSV